MRNTQSPWYETLEMENSGTGEGGNKIMQRPWFGVE